MIRRCADTTSPYSSPSSCSSRVEPSISVNANVTVLGVSLLVWGLVFVYLWRLERRVKELERK